MTIEEKLNEIYKIYSKVSLLSQKNHCKVLRLRHKKLKKDLVLHILPKENPVYEILSIIHTEQLPVIYDTYTLEDGMIVLEEYIDGITAAEIAETGAYRKGGAIKVVREVCKALDVLHRRGIVHRDIKPENIMVTSSGRVILIDFNTSRVTSGKRQDTEIMGTVGYVAPEQLGITQSDTRTDIYSMGILINVLITGQHPSEKMLKGKLGRIVRKCTDIDPGNRFQTAKALYKAL